MPGESFAPIVVPAHVWEQDETIKILTERDVSALLRLVQQHTGASQGRLASALDMSQGRINELINRRRSVTSLGTFERIADGLRMTDTARMALGLAPATPPQLAVTTLAEISETYPSQEAATEDIRKLTKIANSVDVLAVRGLGILALNGSLLRDTLSPKSRVRVFLVDPDSPAAAYRAEEIGESPESFAAGIKLSISRLKELAQSVQGLELYTYTSVPVWRIIALDDTLFVSAFTPYNEGHSGPTHRIEPNARGVLHHAYRRVLNQTAETAHRVI